MRYLLDTHAYLWWVSTPERLSDAVKEILEDDTNEIYFSAASAWELAIKVSIGKLSSSVGLVRLVVEEPLAQNLLPLPVTAAHAARIGDLPLHHGDPFDRLLVAQSQVEEMTLLSRDKQLGRYDVKLLW